MLDDEGMQLEDECRAEPEPAQCHPDEHYVDQSFAESTPEEITRGSMQDSTQRCGGLGALDGTGGAHPPGLRLSSALACELPLSSVSSTAVRLFAPSPLYFTVYGFKVPDV